MIENKKVTSYLLYAVGEVLLVVFGILIALQVNDWDESKKKTALKAQYLKLLYSDLQQDSITLKNQIEYISKDLSNLKNIIARLSSENATIDTLKQIARYEYLPFFNPSNDLNRSAITTLISSGDLKLFDEKMKKKIAEHNLLQLQLIKIMDKNIDIFIADGIIKNEAAFSNHPSTDSVMIRGNLLNKYWEGVQDRDLLVSMPTIISSKAVMQTIILDQKVALRDATNEILKTIRSQK